MKKMRWWHGVLAFAVITIAGVLTSGRFGKRRVRKVYYNRDQAPWAAPGWVFGPAWTFNNAFLVAALVKIFNDYDLKDRNKLLFLQLLIWLDFVTFGWAYFKKQSPVLCEIWTFSDLVFVFMSIRFLWKKNKKLAYLYFPIATWLLYANTVSAYQFLKNDDPYFRSRALLG